VPFDAALIAAVGAFVAFLKFNDFTTVADFLTKQQDAASLPLGPGLFGFSIDWLMTHCFFPHSKDC
jgi:hypothetical protein